jgi:hypothetical protein
MVQRPITILLYVRSPLGLRAGSINLNNRLGANIRITRAMRKATWLLKSFGTHTSIVLNTEKEKLHGMPIFLAKGVTELGFGSVSSKEMRSTLAFRITFGITGRSNKLRSSYGRAIQSISTLVTIQRLICSIEEVDSS